MPVNIRRVGGPLAAARPWRWAGFAVQWQPAGLTVMRRASDWPVELPPQGARLLGCDGQKPLDLLARRIAPFIDSRLELPGVQSQLAGLLTIDAPTAALLRRPRLARCELRLPDGSRRVYPLHWQEDRGELAVLFAQPPRLPQGLQEIRPGVHWVALNDFMPEAEALPRYEALLDALRRLPERDTVVFDTRYNGGGNSQFGRRALQALYGASDPNENDSAAYAEWRVSAFAERTVAERLAQLDGLVEEHDAALQIVRDLQKKLAQARRDGQPWVRQISPSEPPPPARERPFRGRVVLLTDSNCASACLDFADGVLSLPGAIHAGHPTSGDTPYIDIGIHTLPSGLKMWVPLKVWRHRPRGNNQNHRPQWLYPGDLTDTAALQRWVLETVLKPPADRSAGPDPHSAKASEPAQP